MTCKMLILIYIRVFIVGEIHIRVAWFLISNLYRFEIGILLA